MYDTYKALPPSFYKQHTLSLAKQLLGHILVHETDEGVSSGFIVETEAYLGKNDRAAHGYRRRTKRTEIMYAEAGHIYMYQMHTHDLINVVSGEKEDPQAVLIRAVEPYEGMDLMQKRRPVQKKTNLTSGPGKLTKALGITKVYYGETLFEPPLFIAEGHLKGEISTGKRIGIGKAGEAKDYPYRFWFKDNPYVSR